MLDDYHFDPATITDWIDENDFETVGIQLPDGLRTKHKELADDIESRTGAVVLFVADPCYGACDLADATLERLGIDALVHMGHTAIGSDHDIPVLFVPLESKVSVTSVVEKSLDLLEPPVGLLTTAQHLSTLEDVERILKQAGMRSETAIGGGRGVHPGQVLGCSFGPVREMEGSVSSYLFIGSGRFHPLGVVLSTRKKVIAADPFLDTVEELSKERERLLRRRYGLILKAREASSFLVLVSTRSGQTRMSKAIQLRRTLLENVRSVSIALLRSIIPENLMGLRGEILVSTGCPRIALDDSNRYDRPMITPPEMEIALGDREWEDYVLDEF